MVNVLLSNAIKLLAAVARAGFGKIFPFYDGHRPDFISW